MLKDFMVLDQCTKNFDMSSCRDMTWDKQTGYFGKIFALYPCRKYKNQNSKKYKKTPQDVMILHKCTINYDNDIGFLSYGLGQIGRLFWSNFCPLTTLGDLKIKILRKYETSQDIL